MEDELKVDQDNGLVVNDDKELLHRTRKMGEEDRSSVKPFVGNIFQTVISFSYEVTHVRSLSFVTVTRFVSSRVPCIAAVVICFSL